ncbi:MAG: transposase [Deltaproteobacteria bacterium]|nr:transposase [Deltaproteobacteria bacterium]
MPGVLSTAPERPYRPRAPALGLLLDPLELMGRLANLVPPKGQNLVRYHGVFAPNSKHRPALALLAAKATAELPYRAPSPPGYPPLPLKALPEGGGAHWKGIETNVEVRPRRIPWAELLKRVFQADVTTCEKCGGKVEVLAVITDPKVIHRILKHLHLATTPPARGSVTLGARGPPGGALDEGPTIDDLLMDEQP